MQSPTVKRIKLFRSSNIVLSILAAAFIFSLPGCTYKKASEIDQEKRIIGLIVGGGESVSCSSPVTFSSLGPAGVTSNCASCHGTAGGVDLTSYASTSAKVVAGNPEASILYQSINGGTMTQYSNSSIKTAVYCWIKDGAKEN
ncbi:MAG: hypothetical protein OEZ34_07355 [Spirochaetia bacterium]|nr:hypothetical protein [Spirochaetia bacterium]